MKGEGTNRRVISKSASGVHAMVVGGEQELEAIDNITMELI